MSIGSAIDLQCPYCGSTEGIRQDAAVGWDRVMQTWEMTAIYDSDTWCDDCGSHNVEPIEVPIEENTE